MARNVIKHIVHNWGGAISYQFMMVKVKPSKVNMALFTTMMMMMMTFKLLKLCNNV